jgi:hypothetical protein
LPHYNFEVRTQTDVLDTVVVELNDSSAARVEAVKGIGALLHEHAGKLWIDQNWQMDVTNESGPILYVIHVSAMRSTATLHAS